MIFSRIISIIFCYFVQSIESCLLCLECYHSVPTLLYFPSWPMPQRAGVIDGYMIVCIAIHLASEVPSLWLMVCLLSFLNILATKSRQRQSDLLFTSRNEFAGRAHVLASTGTYKRKVETLTDPEGQDIMSDSGSDLMVLVQYVSICCCYRK